MLFEADEFRQQLAHQIAVEELHHGLETKNIFDALIAANVQERETSRRPDPADVARGLDDKDRRVMFEVLFEALPDATWPEAESCLHFLRNRPVSIELAELQKRIESNPPAAELKMMVLRRMELLRLLSSRREPDKLLDEQ
jgi:hypothetical protein